MEMTMVQALNNAMDLEMKKDPSVVLLGEDIGENGGVFRVTDGLIKKYPGRVFDTPLSENGIVGSSIGLAVNGLKPVAEIQFMGFVYPGMQQIVSHMARIRNRSRGKYNVPMVLRMPYGGGIKSPEHHSESTESLFAHIPGLKVVIPSTPYDAKGLMIAAIRDPDPVIFLEPKRLYRAIKQDVPESSYTIPIGEANVVQEGTDLTLISWGSMMRTSLNAIKDSKYSIEAIDLRTISPCDFKTVTDSVNKTGKCVIVQESPKTLGFASELIARINEKSLTSLEAPVQRVTGYDITFPLLKSEQHYLPNEKKVQAAIEKVMNYD